MRFRLRLVPSKRLPEAQAERAHPDTRARPPVATDTHDIDGSWRGVIQAHGGLRGGTLRAPWWARA